MTHERDIERILDHWLADGPDMAPDRVLDAVADRIERQSQQPAWRLHWRDSHVNTLVKPLLGVAAVVVVAVIGVNLVGGSGLPGNQQPDRQPEPERLGQRVVCADDQTGCAGPLAAGEHTSAIFQPALTFTTPRTAG